MSVGIRYDWQKLEIEEIYNTPLLELIYQAASVHRQYHDPKKIQVCQLISIKTGGCPEDCSYCAQSSRYKTEVRPEALLEKETVVNIAQKAKESGISRICMGAAWREVRENSQFDQVLESGEGCHRYGFRGMLYFRNAFSKPSRAFRRIWFIRL